MNNLPERFAGGIKRSASTSTETDDPETSSRNIGQINKKLIQIGNGQIISLSELKTRRTYSYRKGTFKCISSQVELYKFEADSSCVPTAAQYKLIFSSKYISENDMRCIYLGSTLLDVGVRSFGKTNYVHSFKRIDSITRNRIVTRNDRERSDGIRKTSDSGFDIIQLAAGDNGAFNDAIYRELLQQLPNDIRGLFNYCAQFSNLSFLFSLAYCFGCNISALGSFFRVKLSLMLSLMQVKEEPKNNCSLLVMCDDDLVIDRLFRWTSTFAKKYFAYSSTLHSLASFSVKSSAADEPGDDLPTATMFDYTSQPASQPPGPFNRLVVSGTLNLAADGIHFFSSAVNLNALKTKEKAYLEHALESNEIFPKEMVANAADISENTLKTIIWANVATSECTNPKSHWSNLFGSVVLVKEAGLHLPEPKGQLTYEDWSLYFELCSTLNPSVSSAAEDIIRQYFLVNRQYRPASLIKTKSVSILHLLAKSVAKLNLRSQVIKEDALLAVMIFELQLRDLSPGMSPIVFAFDDMTHLTEDDSQNNQLSLTSLLDGTYVASFERALLELFDKNQMDD